MLDCKSVFDTVSNKYNSAVEKYELEEYNGKIKIIADLFISGALSGVASSSVTDTVNNDVVTAMEAYKFAAEFLNKKDSTAYSDSTKISVKICEDLKAVMGENYDKLNVKTVITEYMGGGLLSSNDYNKTFTVTPYYMAAYNSVSDIPQTIDYEIIVYTFNHTVSGKDYVFGGITESKEKSRIPLPMLCLMNSTECLRTNCLPLISRYTLSKSLQI